MSETPAASEGLNVEKDQATVLLASSIPASELRRARLAPSAGLWLLGTLFGIWAARVPSIQANLGIHYGGLGTVLAGLPIGSISAVFYVGRLISRFGSGPVLRIGAVGYTLMFVPTGFIHTPILLFINAVILGSLAQLLDTGANAQGVVVERAYGRSIMSSLHAFYSLGGLVGAAFGALSAWLNWPVGNSFAIGAVVAAIPCLVITSAALPARADKRDASAAKSRSPWTGLLVLLGIIGFCVFMAEGAAADWSAVYLHDHLHASEGTAAIGFVAFSIAMTASRFLGDSVIGALGRLQAVRLAIAIVVCGFVICLATPYAAINIVGWVFVGIGASVVAPVVFGWSGNLPNVEHGSGIARVSGIGYAGILSGPPVIGWIANATSLRLALAVPALACALVGIVLWKRSGEVAESH